MGRASTGGSRCRRSIRLGQEAIAFGNEVLDFLEQEAMPGLGTTDQLGVRRLLREDIGWFRRSHASIGRRSSPRSQGGSTVQSRRLILQTCLASCGGGLRHRHNGAFALLRGQFDTRLHRLAAGPASHLLRGCPSSKPSQRARQLADRIRDMLRLSPLQEDAMTAGRHVRKPDHRSPSLSVLSDLLDDSRRIGRPAADRLQTRALEEQHA